ncbi:efflux RND transporter periplasmic adaptor subunit [Desulforudis sp. 1088]|uniref:efflux RND transporter periplasmic adaptor subunit n=2 Tax=Candidatus Desulforudis TaxID=471826 RepID=UPI003CE58254
MKLKRALAVFVVLGLAVLILGGCGKNEQPAADSAVTPVVVATAEKGRLTRGDVLTGKVAAKLDISLVPKVPGKIAEVLVDVGDRVKAGQVILRLDAPEAAAAVTLAESGLRTAEINYASAKVNYERGKLLLQQEAISQAEFENMYEKPYELAKEAYERTAPAQLAQARANYENTILTAPAAGVVTARTADPGEMAMTGVPVVTIVDLDSVYVECGASEKQINRFKIGQEVMVKIAAVSAEPLRGKITHLSPVADPRTKAYNLKIELKNEKQLIKPGMFAEVDLGAEADEKVLVPRDAVLSREGKTIVFVVENGKAMMREVRTGASDGRRIAVESGLNPGDRVIVTGQDILVDGAPVTIAESDNAPGGDNK